MPEKQLTPEQEKLQEEVKKEAEKNGLSKKDVEELADLAGVVGGMDPAKRNVLLSTCLAFGGAALGAAAMWGGKKAYDKYKGNVTVPKNERDRIDESLLASGVALERFENVDGVKAFDASGNEVNIDNVRSLQLTERK